MPRDLTQWSKMNEIMQSLKHSTFHFNPFKVYVIISFELINICRSVLPMLTAFHITVNIGSMRRICNKWHDKAEQNLNSLVVKKLTVLYI
jgi:hypothetical protein